jgi:hypothetical protein
MPQLIIVSGLFGGNPFVDGILGHNLLLSWALFTISSPFHDGILAIRKPFSRPFLFFTMEFWLSKPFSRTFPFFMMEFWLSGSLSHELFFFSRWNSGYQSLSHELFFFYDGILAIRKPFS